MTEILLSTLNAKYAHSSLALRYLLANLGPLQSRAAIREFVWNERSADMAEEILEASPRVLGLGVYIWNARETLDLVRLLKAVAPELVIVLGGPEVSHEVDQQEIVALADYTITGEGDVAFAELAARILAGERPPGRIIAGGLPELAELASPYPLYSDHDIARRSIYVEASRGCPFRCEFCLSSLDIAVRQFPLEPFLADLEVLMERGAKHFKFIDRTFNLSPRISSRILQFFLDRIDRGLFLHFEMVPDRLPIQLRDLVAQFPPGSIQFEIGIQTFDPDTAERISRKQDLDKLEQNLLFLRDHSSVHVHADLIVGLPGESAESFGRGFDRLVAMGASEIQVGVLKRLRGTTIVRHDDAYQVVYAKAPPYEILQSSVLSFRELARLKRFARAWDLVANRGNFRESTLLLWGQGSPYEGFLRFTDWLADTVGPFKGIALDRLFKLMLDYLSIELEMDVTDAAEVLARDYMRTRNRLPPFLLEHVDAPEAAPRAQRESMATPKRQARHL